MSSKSEQQSHQLKHLQSDKQKKNIECTATKTNNQIVTTGKGKPREKNIKENTRKNERLIELFGPESPVPSGDEIKDNIVQGEDKTKKNIEGSKMPNEAIYQNTKPLSSKILSFDDNDDGDDPLKTVPNHKVTSNNVIVVGTKRKNVEIKETREKKFCGPLSWKKKRLEMESPNKIKQKSSISKVETILPQDVMVIINENIEIEYFDPGENVFVESKLSEEEKNLNQINSCPQTKAVLNEEKNNKYIEPTASKVLPAELDVSQEKNVEISKPLGTNEKLVNIDYKFTVECTNILQEVNTKDTKLKDEQNSAINNQAAKENISVSQNEILVLTIPNHQSANENQIMNNMLGSLDTVPQQLQVGTDKFPRKKVTANRIVKKYPGKLEAMRNQTKAPINKNNSSENTNNNFPLADNSVSRTALGSNIIPIVNNNKECRISGADALKSYFQSTPQNSSLPRPSLPIPIVNNNKECRISGADALKSYFQSTPQNLSLPRPNDNVLLKILHEVAENLIAVLKETDSLIQTSIDSTKYSNKVIGDAIKEKARKQLDETKTLLYNKSISSTNSYILPYISDKTFFNSFMQFTTEIAISRNLLTNFNKEIYYAVLKELLNCCYNTKRKQRPPNSQAIQMENTATNSHPHLTTTSANSQCPPSSAQYTKTNRNIPLQNKKKQRVQENPTLPPSLMTFNHNKVMVPQSHQYNTVYNNTPALNHLLTNNSTLSAQSTTLSNYNKQIANENVSTPQVVNKQAHVQTVVSEINLSLQQQTTIPNAMVNRAFTSQSTNNPMSGLPPAYPGYLMEPYTSYGNGSSMQTNMTTSYYQPIMMQSSSTLGTGHVNVPPAGAFTLLPQYLMQPKEKPIQNFSVEQTTRHINVPPAGNNTLQQYLIQPREKQIQNFSVEQTTRHVNIPPTGANTLQQYSMRPIEKLVHNFSVDQPTTPKTPLQEQVRSSVSRDSGIMSPTFGAQSNCQNGESTDINGTENNLPTISFVTTLNPNCKRTNLGLCVVCNISTIFTCSGCQSIFFCSIKCQEAAWPYHKLMCYNKQ